MLNRSLPWLLLVLAFSASCDEGRYVYAKVTACSPSDPRDKAYYAKYGYEGSKSQAVAADPKVLPIGTQLRVTGYASGRVRVDSRGGSIIRRSSRRGIVQVDVKFPTVAQARAWGTKWMYIEVFD